MRKPQPVLGFVLVGVFALHNIEEALGFPEWAAVHMPPEIASRYQLAPFVLATGFLTGLYLLSAIWAWRAGNRASLLAFALGTAALVANGCVHVMGNVIFDRGMPGFWTALILILPLGLWSLWQMLVGYRRAWACLLSLLVMGAVFQLPLIYSAMWVADMVL